LYALADKSPSSLACSSYYSGRWRRSTTLLRSSCGIATRRFSGTYNGYGYGYSQTDGLDRTTRAIASICASTHAQTRARASIFLSLAQMRDQRRPTPTHTSACGQAERFDRHHAPQPVCRLLERRLRIQVQLWDRARPCHICRGTGRAPATLARDLAA
jgi:hypothetical protein